MAGYINLLEWENEDSQIELTFDQTVTVQESFYPNFSFTKFFAELGGSLGLWLGVGIAQIAINLVQYLQYCFDVK